MTNDDRNTGVRCPKCGCPHLPAFETRRMGSWTVRRRRCRNCAHIVTTREQLIGELRKAG